MAKDPITIREIVRDSLAHTDTFINNVPYDVIADDCIRKIKQKLSHLRRVFYQQLEKNRLLKPYEQSPGSETFVVQKPLSTDEILDIVYDELDICLEGLEAEKKNLKEMSRKET